MSQLKSSYNSPFKDSYSHPIHTRFAMIASNDSVEINLTRNEMYGINNGGIFEVYLYLFVFKKNLRLLKTLK